MDANDPDNIGVLAFILPNLSLKGRQYSEFLTSMDEIERMTGMDFLDKLPDQVKNLVESPVPQDIC